MIQYGFSILPSDKGHASCLPCNPREDLSHRSKTGLMGRISGWLRGGSQGNAILEVALAFPLVLMLMLGIYKFGLAFNSYLQVTTAASQSMYALQREIAASSDPCIEVYNDVVNAAPLLNSANITITLTLTDPGYPTPVATYTGAGTSFSCTPASARVNSTASGSVTIKYPVDLNILGVPFSSTPVYINYTSPTYPLQGPPPS